MSDSTPALLRRRKALVQQLAELEPLVLRGSLIERYKRCGHPGCRCQQGRDTAPSITFRSVRPAADPRWITSPRSIRSRSPTYLQNFQKVRQLLEQICNLNRELLRRRVKF